MKRIIAIIFAVTLILVINKKIEASVVITKLPTLEEGVELLGEYTITAYCPCEKCCGIWAKKPNEIKRGASGDELVAGVSVASPIDFGTNIEIVGIGKYTVHDRTANWIVDRYNSKIIDIYFNTHEEVINFKKKALVYKIAE